VQGCQEEVVSAARTPPRLPFLIIFTFHTIIVYIPQISQIKQIILSCPMENLFYIFHRFAVSAIIQRNAHI
jgi:hypothetical protein